MRSILVGAMLLALAGCGAETILVAAAAAVGAGYALPAAEKWPTSGREAEYRDPSGVAGARTADMALTKQVDRIEYEQTRLMEDPKRLDKYDERGVVWDPSSEPKE